MTKLRLSYDDCSCLPCKAHRHYAEGAPVRPRRPLRRVRRAGRTITQGARP